MSIEISNLHQNAAVGESAPQARSPQSPPEKSAEVTGGSQNQPVDHLSLTPAAQQLRGLEQQIADQPVVDTQKVSAIREAIANGSYEMDPERIAEKVLDLEKALGDLS